MFCDVFQVFSRHEADDGTRWPQHEVMSQLNQEVDRLHQQYHVRIIGENGVAKGIIDLVNPIETWQVEFVYLFLTVKWRYTTIFDMTVVFLRT